MHEGLSSGRGNDNTTATQRMNCVDDPTASHERSLLDWPATRDRWGCAQEVQTIVDSIQGASLAVKLEHGATSGEAILERTRR